jgi:hypothetical protein
MSVMYLQAGAVPVQKSAPGVRRWLYENADNVRGKRKAPAWDADNNRGEVLALRPDEPLHISEGELNDLVRASFRDEQFRVEFRRLVEQAVARAVLEHKGRMF